tara:strand:+ start:584 stop:1285 length:702 start_codon:yes stop_codon:yes gene_type:complete
MSIKKDLLEYLQKNRVSTTEVADSLQKTGAIDGLKLINPNNNNIHKVGKVRCVFAAYESNYLVHDQIKDVKEGEIVLIFTYECGSKAIIGDLIAKYLLLYRGVNAILVNGNVRDVAKLIKENYPIWAHGSNPIGCVNNFTKPFPPKEQFLIKRKFKGAIAVCDAGGVVIIENSKIDKKILNNIKSLEAQEDLWYFCLDNLKWTTKEIVCEKKYLKTKNILSPSQIKKVNDYLK